MKKFFVKFKREYDSYDKVIEAHRFIIDEYQNAVFERLGKPCFLIKREDYLFIERVDGKK